MIKKDNPVCRKCGAKLNNDNWNPSHRKTNQRTCRTCLILINKEYIKKNPRNEYYNKYNEEHREYRRIYAMERSHDNGTLPMDQNKQCSSYLGVHIAEQVLSKVFKDVEIMSYGNKGFDFICAKDKKIDVKSSCNQKRGNYRNWVFNFKHNQIADYFLCIAFDNRNNLNPLHLWLLPSNRFDVNAVSISENSIDKWDVYRLDINMVVSCCNTLKGGV